ncbi:hypothetical protein AXF42_Ash002097 [Apostasia shenzhenica]|uniref:Uncharacterized protein n=1 Tax=Apostasia shenzhenica TaxID=1088818 RepID=A0A2I0AMM8_9ASPA|nr:hypothetical protein AXF42_Ash002097 [Apostasia shenzhenica]
MKHFLKIPPFSQNLPLVSEIIKRWKDESHTFKFHQLEFSFSPEIISQLIGLPNRGIIVSHNLKQSSSILAHEVKDNLKSYAMFDSPNPHMLVVHIVKFILSNLFFPTRGYTVSPCLLEIAEDLYSIGGYNWCRVIFDFLHPQLPLVAKILRTKVKETPRSSAGYVDGFIQLVMVSNSLFIKIRSSYVAPESTHDVTLPLGVAIYDPTSEPDPNPIRKFRVWVMNFDPFIKRIGFGLGIIGSGRVRLENLSKNTL